MVVELKVLNKERNKRRKAISLSSRCKANCCCYLDFILLAAAAGVELLCSEEECILVLIYEFLE